MSRAPLSDGEIATAQRMLGGGASIDAVARRLCREPETIEAWLATIVGDLKRRPV